MLRKIYYSVSPNLRFLLRKTYYFPIDFYEGITGKRGKNTPKKGDIFIGSGDFVKQGKAQIHLLKTYIDLKPSDNVLDIGCGIGRTAVPLTEILDKTSFYEGFDAVKKGIDWCNENIKSKFPNFNFSFTPLRNTLYNKSEANAATFKFPYEENNFDKAFLFSVFTHMKLDDIQNYLNEIHRVLKPDGACLATFFTYTKNDQLENFPGFKFPFKRDGYRLLDENVEEANIAIDMDILEGMITNSGLKMERKIDGYWKDLTKDKKDINFQDIIILKK